MSLRDRRRRSQRWIIARDLFELGFRAVLNKLASSMINVLSAEDVMRKRGHERSRSPRVLSRVDYPPSVTYYPQEA